MTISLSTMSKKPTRSKKTEPTCKPGLTNPDNPPPPIESDELTEDDNTPESKTKKKTTTVKPKTIKPKPIKTVKPKDEKDHDKDKKDDEIANQTEEKKELPKPKSKNTKTETLKNVKERIEVNSLLSQLYPSNHIKKKVDALEKISTLLTPTPSESTLIKSKKKLSPVSTISSKEKEDDPIANALINSIFSENTSPITNLEKPSTSKINKKEKKEKKYNIIIHVEPNDISKRFDFSKKYVDDNDDDDDSDEDYVPGSSSSDASWRTYDDEEEEYYDEDDETFYSSSDSESEEFDISAVETQQQKYTDELNMLKSLRKTYEDLLTNAKNKRVVLNQLKTLDASEQKIKEDLDELTHKHKSSNSKKFRKLLKKKSTTNDLEYFKTHLSLKQQSHMIDELLAVSKISEIQKPYKLTLLESDIPREMKAVAIRKIGMLQYMDPGCGEYCKLKNWVDAFMRIPFNQFKNIPITISDGIDSCHSFMTNSKKTLDSAVYGLNDAKMQIMQMVGQWLSNPNAIGTAVAIHGPPGTGKTSLVKEGISKILGRDFAFIALGGATDSSFLEGHSYTYEGSTWGKIVDILIRCKSSNPVIYFDELDKISDTSKGDELVGILTHLTDTTQNNQFHDKYFSEIHFDLSKCLFIFSYNDESRVNPILLDRMYKIRTNGYSVKDKVVISKNYLIPRICNEVSFKQDDILMDDSTIEHIIQHHTNKESGVRNLKRCIETIYTKLNLYRLIHPGTTLFDEKETSFEVGFPFTVTSHLVDKLIKANQNEQPNINMYL